MTDLPETQIADLIAALPPPPRGWVRAAQLLPALRADLDAITGSLAHALQALGGDAAEAQSPRLPRLVGDDRLGWALDDVREALDLMGGRESDAVPEVMAHRFTGSDRRIMRSVEHAERGLARLREVAAAEEPDGRDRAEVEAHTLARDEQARQAIPHLEHALALLRALRVDGL